MDHLQLSPDETSFEAPQEVRFLIFHLPTPLALIPSGSNTIAMISSLTVTVLVPSV